MSKTIHGLIWSNQHADGTITIGFTNECINSALQECFHVLPAETKAVSQKGPLLVLETNDGLQTIKAPFAGKVTYFNPKARNFPDRLKETETIVTLAPPGAKVPNPKTVKVKMNRTEELAQPAADMWITQQQAQEANWGPVQFNQAFNINATTAQGRTGNAIDEERRRLQEAENMRRQRDALARIRRNGGDR